LAAPPSVPPVVVAMPESPTVAAASLLQFSSMQTNESSVGGTVVVEDVIAQDDDDVIAQDDDVVIAQEDEGLAVSEDVLVASVDYSRQTGDRSRTQ